MACRDGNCDRCKLVCADLHIEELEAEVNRLKSENVELRSVISAKNHIIDLYKTLHRRNRA